MPVNYQAMGFLEAICGGSVDQLTTTLLRIRQARTPTIEGNGKGGYAIFAPSATRRGVATAAANSGGCGHFYTIIPIIPTIPTIPRIPNTVHPQPWHGWSIL